MAVCRDIAETLARVGNVLWATGFIFGDDRVSLASPYEFGEDATVGVATVAQIGGELARGAVVMLDAGNLYAAGALIRQLVEIQYLAHSFEEQHEIAAQWLRADHEERRNFWSPRHLRRRAGGKFLSSDYSHHCEMGGHPTMSSFPLLPGHQMLHPEFLWVDLANHLVGIWQHVSACSERLVGGPVPEAWAIPDIAASVMSWSAKDGLSTALVELNRALQVEHGPRN